MTTPVSLLSGFCCKTGAHLGVGSFNVGHEYSLQDFNIDTYTFGLRPSLPHIEQGTSTYFPLLLLTLKHSINQCLQRLILGQAAILVSHPVRQSKIPTVTDDMHWNISQHHAASWLPSLVSPHPDQLY